MYRLKHDTRHPPDCSIPRDTSSATKQEQLPTILLLLLLLQTESGREEAVVITTRTKDLKLLDRKRKINEDGSGSVGARGRGAP